jgi:hypothetical protein
MALVKEELPVINYYAIVAIDASPFVLHKFSSAADLAVFLREIRDTYSGSDVYVQSCAFAGQALSLPNGPNQCLVVPFHDPSDYPLFGQNDTAGGGETTWLYAPSETKADPIYQQVTEDEEVDEANLAPPDDLN